MRTQIMLGIGLIFLGSAASVHSQEVVWRAAKPTQAETPVSLGRPTPLQAQATLDTPRVVRGQIGDPPPPPVFPGSSAPVFPGGGAGGADLYNRGAATHDGDLGGFWSRVGDKFKRCWDDVSGGVGGAFQGGTNRQMFQSDPCFQAFASPVTNPFFFVDPRALTEIRPVFIWQHTPNANPVWNGGNNYEFAVTGSVALTEHISVVINRLGLTSIHPRGGALDSGTGFSEFLLGPKLTFLRNETSNTVAAVGLTFDIPSGSSRVLQDTGHLSLVPYFSIAQNFGSSTYGSFNFMNTTGYAFRTDNTRSESIYSSFHFDYDWGNTHRIYPLIEANWRHYTRNGGARALNFEGNDLANFGSNSVSGRNELTLALGARVILSKNISWGVAGEFNVLANGDGRHLDQFRFTTDFIFRY